MEHGKRAAVGMGTSSLVHKAAGTAQGFQGLCKHTRDLSGDSATETTTIEM